jgi:uncharacterized protein (TIGR02246 family)
MVDGKWQMAKSAGDGLFPISPLPFAILLCLVTAPASAAVGAPQRRDVKAQQSAPRRDDLKAREAEIREVVAQYVAARERRDGDAIRALFTEDADQLTSSGDWRKGREEIVRGTLASSERTGGTRTIRIEAVRFPAPGVAVADGRYEIAGGQDGVRRMWTSFLLTREAGGWRIAAIRNMLPAPPAK